MRLLALGAAADWYVAPNGSDASAGTREAPFATLGRCAVALTSPGACVLRAGTYHVDPPAELRGLHGSALAGYAVRAAPGEAVRLDGTVPIAAGWSWTR